MPARPPAPSLSLLRQLHGLAFPHTSQSPQLCLQAIRRPICPPTNPLRHVHRLFSTTKSRHEPTRSSTRNPYAPKSRDRGPKSTEDTQTDFGAMDIMNTSNAPQPATSIDACTSDGFHLNNGMKTGGGKGVLLVGGECFTWDFWRGTERMSEGVAVQGAVSLIDTRGTLMIPESAFGVLEVLHPKPDLLLLGTGGKLWMLSKKTREYISGVLGIRVDVMDTANASAAYNLLAQERGVEGGGGVGAALLPLGWTGKIK